MKTADSANRALNLPKQCSSITPDGKPRRFDVAAGFWIWFLALFSTFGQGLGGLTPSALGVERWADERLIITNAVELWFDASRQNAGRSALQLPSLSAGNPVDYLIDGSGRARHLSQPRSESRPRLRQEFAGAFLTFDGEDDSLSASLLRGSFTNLTVFIVAAPRTNAGNFRGFFGFSQAGRNDYQTGLNLDFGPWSSPGLTMLNSEGSGFSGAVNLTPGLSIRFRQWHLFALTCRSGANGVRLSLDGKSLAARDRQPTALRLDEFVLGARHYSNSPEPPHTQGFFEGDIAEYLQFSRALPDAERLAVEKYLNAKYARLLALDVTTGDGATALVAVTNPPSVQMLVPGFAARELPVALPNINNVKYRPDGKLVAAGYNGRVWLLSDTNGDGLEDKADLFWDRDTIHAPIGMALTPPGYALGQGVFLPAKGKLSLVVDTNADDRADSEIVVATWSEKSEQQGVDALGVALDNEGNIYFGLGTASFTGAYLIDKTTGRSRYNLGSERGTILKVSPDFQRREIVCTGIRFPVGLAFNREGDLFCADQEGATWLPNGNPLDELLHIQPGRHYGFPPRHPAHLPNVIDEPSVFDYAPQHQSTCGLNFNEGPSLRGPDAKNEKVAPHFGPARWQGDAILSGYSRGKLYRTKLVKTTSGYVAQNQLFACLSALTVDACVSPRGDLVVATHSGLPDWGSGPTGPGKLYQLRHTAKVPAEPVLAWFAGPGEIRIAFDRPLEPARLKSLAQHSRVTNGRYVFAGDRFETLRPGYQVVYDQLAAPRFDLPVLGTSLSADGRTLALVTPARVTAVNYALTLPNSIVAPDATPPEALHSGENAHDEMDLLAELNGVAASWRSDDGIEAWDGWLPHPDLVVAKALTQGSAEHERLWASLEKPGALTLRGQLNLWQMLQPAIQPGARLDYDPPAESVNVVFAGTVWPEAKSSVPHSSTRTRNPNNEVKLARKGRENDWLPFSLVVPTGTAEPHLSATWFTADDPRPRAFPLRRFLLPWAKPDSGAERAPTERRIPEIAGGRWLAGKQLFFSESLACARCHRIRGEGGDAGPDLSNLIHRDYSSVLKDIREPSAAINPDHVAFNVELADGEGFTAVLKADGREQMTFADATGRHQYLSKAKIKSLRPSSLSLMPDSLLQALDKAQLRDLMTFLLTSPLEPAPVEAPNPPAPRSRAEFAGIIAAAQADAGKSDLPAGRADRETPGAKDFNVVLCAGPKDHGPGEHDYPLWQKRWEKLLALADHVKVATAESWPSPEQFKTADVIAFYSNNPGWRASRADELDAFLARGGGLVYLHYAVDGQKDVEALAQRIGLAWQGGRSKFRHGALALKLHSHPLAAGLPKPQFIDESYWNLIGDPKSIELLASGEEEGEERPLLWTKLQGGGRVFVSIPGHYNWTFDDPIFRLLVLRGICWAGGQPLNRLSELTTIGARIGE